MKQMVQVQYKRLAVHALLALNITVDRTAVYCYYIPFSLPWIYHPPSLRFNMSSLNSPILWLQYPCHCSKWDWHVQPRLHARRESWQRPDSYWFYITMSPRFSQNFQITRHLLWEEFRAGSRWSHAGDSVHTAHVQAVQNEVSYIVGGRVYKLISFRHWCKKYSICIQLQWHKNVK